MQHKNLQRGEWQKLSLVEQLTNVGSEVFRAINWQKKGNREYATLAFHRALELLDAITAHPIRPSALREILRTREALVDYFAGDNQFSSTDTSWERYFFSFNYLSAKKRETLTVPLPARR